MNKIIGVSDGTHFIPVSWKLNAGIADEDIPLHDAMIQGTVMARGIDVMRLWDGTLTFNQKIGTFAISGYIGGTIVNLSENIITSECENNYNFTEEYTPVAILGYNPIAVKITAILPTINNVSVYNTDDTNIVVKFDNPIYCEDENILGFTFTALIGQVSNEITPTAIEQISLNKIQFTFNDFSDVNTIVVIYNNETGNIKNNIDGNLINYFAKTFAPNMTYSEGE